MSLSFRLPEEEPVCECKYDDLHDRMDREDCPFHCDMVEGNQPADSLRTLSKPAALDSVVARRRKRRAEIINRRAV